jgi:hypothetical protein
MEAKKVGYESQTPGRGCGGGGADADKSVTQNKKFPTKLHIVTC